MLPVPAGSAAPQGVRGTGRAATGAATTSLLRSLACGHERLLARVRDGVILHRAAHSLRSPCKIRQGSGLCLQEVAPLAVSD